MKRAVDEISPFKRLRFRVEAVALRALAWVIPKFPRHTLLRFSRGLGWLAYHVLRQERRIARANLDTAFGDSKSAAEKTASRGCRYRISWLHCSACSGRHG
jgi:lauroyl/myristoyl acyltransferase